MQKVLITGIAGFIGSNIAKRFLAEGWLVFGVDNLVTGRLENIPKGAKFTKADVNQINELKCLKNEHFEIILHLAGQSSGENSYSNPVSDLMMNAASTLELIKFAISKNIKKLILASSMSVYGSVIGEMADESMSPAPLSCYGVSKLAAENYLKVFKSQLNGLSMRMFNVYGVGQDLQNMKQGMVSIYIAQAVKDKQIIVKGSLERFRDFICIKDVVELWWLASTKGWKDDISALNLGTGKKTKVKDLIAIIGQYTPIHSIVEEEPTKGDQFGIYANNKLLQDTIGKYEFSDLKDEMQKFVEWSANVIK